MKKTLKIYLLNKEGELDELQRLYAVKRLFQKWGDACHVKKQPNPIYNLQLEPSL